MSAGVLSPVAPQRVVRGSALPDTAAVAARGNDPSAVSRAAAEPLRRGKRRRVRFTVFSASASDHAAIFYFLNEVCGGPNRAEFKSSLEDPFYDPRDRLMFRRGSRILAHVHVTHRVMQFGSLRIPVAGLDGLAVAPSCRAHGLGTHLLAGAEKHMAEAGALVGLLRTHVPHFFRRSGWALCGRHQFCQANTHAVLARLVERGLRPGRHPKIHVRPWRRWEEKALARIYHQNLVDRHGPLERTPAYWHWLLRRHAYDQLYVALDGPDLWDLNEATTTIVGYAAIRGQRIVELMTAPGRRKAAMHLLARACGDAIEQDRHGIILHAPENSPLMEIFDEAGGWRHDHEFDQGRVGSSARGEVYMARLLDPLGLLRLLCGEFFRRAETAGLSRPQELGLLVDGRKYQIEIARRDARATANRMGRSYLRLNVADFTRLLLGQLDWDRARAEGRIEPSTALADEAGRALFPALPLWRPPWDDLTASP